MLFVLVLSSSWRLYTTSGSFLALFCLARGMAVSVHKAGMEFPERSQHQYYLSASSKPSKDSHVPAAGARASTRRRAACNFCHSPERDLDLPGQGAGHSGPPRDALRGRPAEDLALPVIQRVYFLLLGTIHGAVLTILVGMWIEHAKHGGFGLLSNRRDEEGVCTADFL